MKGGDFERKIAKDLSLWWTGGERTDVFYRSHSSGGRFTMRRKTGKDTANQAGDLTFSDSIGESLIKAWNVECKSGYGSKTKSGITRWDVLDFIDSKQEKPILLKMWEQCDRDAELSNRTPVLIVRRNQRKACIIVRRDYFHQLTDFFGQHPFSFLHIYIPMEELIIMSLEDFFEWIPNIRAALKQKELRRRKLT